MSNKWILSATEIENFDTCQRKWGYLYLDRIKPPPTPAAQLGSAVHLTLQKYLSGESITKETKEGRIAFPGLPFLPKALSTHNVERPIFFSANGNIFHGYIDFYEQIGSQKWLIGDHKTCSSFRTAINSEQLKTNIQANIYAQWAFKELGAESVKLNWIYYRTKGKPEARLVETEIKKSEAISLFEHPLRIATNIMAIVKEKPDSSSLPKNTSACFKYGPCPFLGSCKANPKAKTSNCLERITLSNTTKTQDEIVSQKSKTSFHLFIDCTPIKQSSPYQKTIELSELLSPVLKKIHHEKNLAHYRLAGYGQHVGLMAQYLEEHIKETNYDESTAIVSSSKTPEGIDTLQTLSAAASMVIRGF